MDNLQSMTYQTFEQDPVKYRNYEEVKKGLLIPSLYCGFKMAFFDHVLPVFIFRPYFVH